MHSKIKRKNPCVIIVAATSRWNFCEDKWRLIRCGNEMPAGKYRWYAGNFKISLPTANSAAVL